MAGTEFTVESTNGASAFRLVGELDMSTAPLLEHYFSRVEGPLTLDLSKLTFIDSCGLTALRACAVGRDGHGPVTLLHVSPFTMRVFEIVGFDRMSEFRIR